MNDKLKQLAIECYDHIVYLQDTFDEDFNMLDEHSEFMQYLENIMNGDES